MLIDQDILLATSEAIPNAGAVSGGLGGNSITGVAATPKIFDLARTDSPNGMSYDQLSSTLLEARVIINTSFTQTAADHTVEFQLVTMHIDPLLLTAATTSGRLTSVATVTVATTGIATLTGHGLGLGTPVYFSSVTGGGGDLNADTMYYVVPLTVDTIGFAGTFADALAGTLVTPSAAVTASVLEFLPQVHLTTGAIPVAFLKQGIFLSGRTIIGGMSGVGKTGDSYTGGARIPQGMIHHIGDSVGGAGGPLFPTVGRYLVPRILVAGGAADTTGRYSIALGLATGSGERHYPSGIDIQ